MFDAIEYGYDPYGRLAGTTSGNIGGSSHSLPTRFLVVSGASRMMSMPDA